MPEFDITKFMTTLDRHLMALKLAKPDVPEEVQLEGVRIDGSNILYIKSPTDIVINTALLDKDFIISFPQQYHDCVNRFYFDNQLMKQKWLRYAKQTKEKYFGDDNNGTTI